ncbi:MAG: DHH family phosphoesterase [Candidatus Nanopelagicales bacterium]|nr:DHH family phosphoesterase [Candidatus Nanopelagicales bacterium]
MNATFDQIAEHLRAADQVLLVAHVNPDADALGSTLATALALEALGIAARVTFPDEPFEVPAGLQFLPRRDLFTAPQDADQADVVLAMDASSGDRIGSLLDVGEVAPIFIAIDHHASFVPFAPIVHVDATRPATGLLALDLIDALGVELNPDMALCLYAAISADTGSFRFASTTSESLRAAARLMDVGIDFAGAAKALFDTRSRGFLAMQSDALAGLDVRSVGGHSVAIAHVAREDRQRHDVAFSEVESLIDVVRSVEGAEVAVVVKEDDAGLWRISSRSLGTVDVGAACTACGGGGHRMAAGFTGGPDPHRTLADFLTALG